MLAAAVRRFPFALALAGLATAQADAPPPVLDDAWLRGVVARVLPEVERACGRKLARPPVVALADAVDVMAALRAELAPDVEAFFAGQPRARVRKALQQRVDLLASSLLGKYAIDDKEIHVLAHLAPIQLGFVQRGAVRVDHVLELVVAHELVHALQDQELDLAARLRGEAGAGGDALQAFVALIEAHAVFCSERAAEALDRRLAIDALRSVLVGERDLAATPGADLATRRQRGGGLLHYLRPLPFLRQAHAEGGDERLWQLLAGPAPGLRLLGAAADGRPRTNLVEHFAGVDARLAGASWTVGRGGIDSWRLLAENLPRGDELLALFVDLDGGAEWFAMAPTPASWRALYLLSFASDGAAARFVALAEAVAAHDLKDSPLRFERGDGPAIPGAVSRRATQAPASMFPPAARAELVWARRGRHVLQVTCVNAPLPDAELAPVAEALLAGLDR